MAKDIVPYDPAKLRADQARVEGGFWDKVRRHARRLPFLDDAAAAYYTATDPATPIRVKAVLFGALAYLVLPADVIPDMLSLVGFTDDAAVLYAAVRTVRPHIKERHRQAARAALDRLLAPSA